MSAREHLESIRSRQKGKANLLDDEPDLDPAVEHIWGWWCQLTGTRGGGFGPAPITYLELDAWSKLTGNDPTRWEVERIMEIDRLWLAHTAESNPKPKPTSTDNKDTVKGR